MLKRSLQSIRCLSSTSRRRGLTTSLALILAVSAGLVLAPAVMAAPQAKKSGKKMDDAEITQAVENELYLELAHRSYGIDTHTDVGVVTLEGTVDNLLTEQRAINLTETVKGVRAVIDKLEVNTPTRPDAEIRRDVTQALLTDTAADSYQIRATVNDGRVTLTGDVESWHERELAGRLAKGVRGVKAVENNIDVEFAAERSDREIREDVESRLKWDRFVDASLVDVEVEDGAVTLTGTVGSLAEKTRARSRSWVNGATSVDSSNLEVESWAKNPKRRNREYVVKTDSEIADAVRDALFHDPRVSSFKVTVKVDAGTVTLSGIVDNLAAKKAAVRDARNTVGVWDVRDRVQIRPQVRTDKQITNAVESALLRDPYVSSFEIGVATSGGKVYLAGDVDSFFEKAQAEEVASRVNGVVAVQNNIDVSYDAEPIATSPYTDDWTAEDFDWYVDPVAVTTSKSDRVIRKDIEDEFFWSPFVDGDQVNVSVEDGVATLTGKVDSFSEFSAARENAFDGGAIRVVNKLRINGQG